MHRFEHTLDALRRIVYRTQGMLVGMDRAKWERTIAEVESRAMQAYETNDGPAWRRAFNEVQALLETAGQEEFAQMRLDDPAYMARRLAAVVAYANRVEAQVGDLVPSASEEVRAMQLTEKARVEAWLRDKVQKPLAALDLAEEGKSAGEKRQALSQIEAELERIESAAQRIPSLGVVTDRGAG
jgi:molecular chaperone DnaK